MNAGDRVYWWRTLGGGGGSGHRANGKVPVEVTFVRHGRGEKVEIETLWPFREPRRIWVHGRNVTTTKPPATKWRDAGGREGEYVRIG